MDKLKDIVFPVAGGSGDAPSAAAGPRPMRTSGPVETDHVRAPLLLDLTTVFMRVAEPLTLLAAGLVMQLVLSERIGPSASPIYLRAALLGAIFYAGVAEAIGAYDMDVRFSMRRATGRRVAATLRRMAKDYQRRAAQLDIAA